MEGSRHNRFVRLKSLIALDNDFNCRSHALTPAVKPTAASPPASHHRARSNTRWSAFCCRLAQLRLALLPATEPDAAEVRPSDPPYGAESADQGSEIAFAPVEPTNILQVAETKPRLPKPSRRSRCSMSYIQNSSTSPRRPRVQSSRTNGLRRRIRMSQQSVRLLQRRLRSPR
jgi:hypothetical protein